MHFRRGEYAEAEASYTKSLQGKETAALSNRAMVRLKLGKAEACAKDCQRSVDLLLEEDEVGEATSKRDGLLVKTWQRKGTAEMEMKMYREAAASFENALRIEPESRTIREQRKAAVKEMEMIEVKDGEVELRARDFLAKRQRVSIEKKKELETPSPAAIVQTKKKEAMAKEEMKTTTMDIEKVRKAISKLDHDEEEIKTGPIFDKQWKLAATSSEKKCKILRAVRGKHHQNPRRKTHRRPFKGHHRRHSHALDHGRLREHILKRRRSRKLAHCAHQNQPLLHGFHAPFR